MQRWGVLVLAAVLLVIAACGSSGTPGAQPAGASSNDAVPLVVKITSCTSHDPITYSMEQFKQKHEAKMDGRFKVEVYPSCQLGSSDQMVQQVIAGNVHIFVTPTAFLSGIEPLMTVIDLPYLFPDVRAATEYLNAEGKRALEDKLNAKGISAPPEFHKELVEASEQVYTKLYARVPDSKEWIDHIKEHFAK